jgi:hypothetical protein
MILPGIGGFVIGGAAALPYVETGILGYNGVSPSAFDFQYGCSDAEHGGFLFTVPSGGRYVKTWHIIVQSTTAGNKMKLALWNSANGTSLQSTDTLLKSGQEISFPSTLSGVATEFSANVNSDGSAYFIPAGTFGIGYHASGSTTVKALLSGGNTTYFKGSDTYADGTEATFGTVGSTGKNAVFWMPSSVGGS